MAVDSPIPSPDDGFLKWVRSPAGRNAIGMLNRLCSLEIAFGGKRFGVTFSGENAAIDLKETIVSSTGSLPAIAAYSVLGNPTAAGATPVSTSSPILASVIFGGSGGSIAGSGGAVTITATGSNTVNVVGNWRTLKAASPLFCSIESDDRAYGCSMGVFQNTGGVRAWGGYLNADTTSSDFSFVVRKNAVDTTAFRVLNTDATVNFLSTIDATSTTAGAAKFAGGIAVAKTIYCADLRITTSAALAANSYLNFGSTIGSGGYGFRDNGGTMEYKNSAGAWAAFSAGGGGSPGGSNTELQYNASGSFGGITGATSNGTSVTFGSGNLAATSPKFTTSLDDANGNELFKFTATGSAVNEITLANGAAGTNPTFTASGGDTNVGLDFISKGTGAFFFKTTATSAYIHINNVTGSPNAGISLEENGASKWAIASYSSGTFTFYNNGLNAEALGISSTNIATWGNTTDASSASAASVIFSGGIGVAKKIITGSSLATAAPSGASAGDWKFGSLVSGAVTVDTSRSIYVDIGGVVYKLIVAT